MQEQTSSPVTESKPAAGAPVQKIAENPNPRANENIKQTAFDGKETTDDGATDVGTEITDGEAG